jgi:hypothetical protein
MSHERPHRLGTLRAVRAAVSLCPPARLWGTSVLLNGLQPAERSRMSKGMIGNGLLWFIGMAWLYVLGFVAWPTVLGAPVLAMFGYGIGEEICRRRGWLQ